MKISLAPTVTLASAAALLLGLAVFGSHRILPENSLERVRESGVIRVGYAEEAPFAFVDKGGRVTGQAPEIARLIAARMNLRIEWVQTNFSSLIPELSEKRFDMIAARMFITPEREKLTRFSEPNLRVSPGLLVVSGNPLSLNSYADIVSNPKVRVAVLSGSVEEKRLLGRGIQNEQLVRVPDADTGCVAVATGVVDTLALSLPTLRGVACGNGTLVVLRVKGRTSTATLEPADDYCAFAFARDDDALFRAWNATEKAAMGQLEYFAAIEPFGFVVDDIPLDMTLAAILRR